MNYQTGALIVGGLAGLVSLWVSWKSTLPSPQITKKDFGIDDGIPLELRDGRILEYFEFGSASSDVVLIALHGANTTGKMWILVDEWAKQNNVRMICPSLPGWGLSSANLGYTYDQWVDDVKQLLDRIQVKQFHLIGASFGSSHAVALACLLPDPFTVKNVMLYVGFQDCSSSSDPLNGSQLKVFTYLHKSPLFGKILLRFLILPLLRVATAKTDVERSVRWQWEGSWGCTPTIYQPWNFGWKELVTQTQLPTKKNSIHRKVYIVSGLQDDVAPPYNQKYMQGHIDGSILIEFEGNHDTPLRNPQIFTNHLSILIKD